MRGRLVVKLWVNLTNFIVAVLLGSLIMRVDTSVAAPQCVKARTEWPNWTELRRTDMELT